MYGIGGDPFDSFGGDPFGRQGLDFDAGTNLVGRILTAEYQLGVNMHNRVGQQMAPQSLAQIIGLGLGRIFR